MAKETKRLALTVEAVEADKFSVDNLRATLMQKVETTYSWEARRFSNELQGNIFSASDFGIENNTETHLEKRFAWIPVPNGTTVESLTEALTKFPEACIYKILSSEVILTEGQKHKISIGELELEDIKTKQLVVDKETGEIVLDSYNQPMYRVTAFSPTAEADIDNRVLIQKPIENNVISVATPQQIEEAVSTFEE